MIQREKLAVFLDTSWANSNHKKRLTRSESGLWRASTEAGASSSRHVLGYYEGRKAALLWTTLVRGRRMRFRLGLAPVVEFNRTFFMEPDIVLLGDLGFYLLAVFRGNFR
jgi:hypothetical protein